MDVQQFVRAHNELESESEHGSSNDSLARFFEDTLEAEEAQVKEDVKTIEAPKMKQMVTLLVNTHIEPKLPEEPKQEAKTEAVAPPVIILDNRPNQLKRAPSKVDSSTDAQLKEWFKSNVKPAIEKFDIEVDDLKTQSGTSLEIVKDLYVQRRSVPEPVLKLSPATANEFKGLLRRISKTLNNAWRTVLDKESRGKVTFASFSRICREIGYEGSILKTWKFLVGRSPFLTRDLLVDSAPQKAANDLLAKLQIAGDLVFIWQHHFPTPSGFLDLEIFRNHCERLFPGFDATAAFRGLSCGTDLVCLEDLDSALFDLEIQSPRLRGVNQQAEVHRFMQAVAGKYGSLGRAWQKIFKDTRGTARVVNLIDFSKAVRLAGFRGGCKDFFLHLTNGRNEPVSLKSFDLEIAENLTALRCRFDAKLWLQVDKEQNWFIGMDKWISRNLEISSHPGAQDLEKVFHFLDFDECGFITPDDLDAVEISNFRDTQMYPGLVSSFRHCTKAKMDIRPSLLDTFERRHGGIQAVWDEWLDPTKKGSLRFAEFWGAVKGLGWSGSVKKFWIQNLGLMRHDNLTLETLLKTHD